MHLFAGQAGDRERRDKMLCGVRHHSVNGWPRSRKRRIRSSDLYAAIPPRSRAICACLRVMPLMPVRYVFATDYLTNRVPPEEQRLTIMPRVPMRRGALLPGRCIDGIRRKRNAALCGILDASRQFLGALDKRRELTRECAKTGQPSARVFDHASRPELFPDPFSDNRLRGAPHVELWIERAADTFDNDHRLLQHHQFSAGLHVEQRRDFEQQRQQLRHRNLVGGMGVDGLADSADGLRKIIDAMGARHITGFKMYFRNAPIIARDENRIEFRQENAAPSCRDGP